MGTKFAPSYANLFMAQWEEDFIWRNNHLLEHTELWKRYIDDIIVIWKETLNELTEFTNYINTNNLNLEFTQTHSNEAINFLDLTIYIEDDEIHTKTYIKSVDCNNYIPGTSNHHNNWLKGIPGGQFKRIKRNCSNNETFEEQTKTLQEKFLVRNYNKNIVQKSIEAARETKREDLLKYKDKNSEEQREITFITNYNSQYRTLERILRKNWSILRRDEEIQELMHHKAVNLTNIKLNHSQEFVQIPLGQTTAPEHIWKTRRGCLSGRIVALKCSECGSRSKSSRIIGGSDVTLGRWPWQVSLYLNNKHVCGGSIVAHQWIITAAHCVHNYRSPQLSSWSVLSGIVSHSPVRLKTSAVEKIIYHQKYDDRSHDYDIALMKLEKPLNYSDSIRPVCLPQYDQDLPAGSECWISGWGHTQPDNTHMPHSLKEAMVPLISTKKCNSSCIYDGDITPRMLCAGFLDGKVDACQQMT
ncbi:transmembrane protease serine 5-like [Pseudophryne corroboree]|uniref:transmembrane protease serine 5-like n=1 Tax=Pseudophryne corroboree TaxID=495146 RepID=UPI003081A0F3